MRGSSRSPGRSRPALWPPHLPTWSWRLGRLRAHPPLIERRLAPAVPFPSQFPCDPPGPFLARPTSPRRHARAVLGSFVPTAAFCASYPDRPIKLIVALAAGGPADSAARVFAPYFSEALGQSVFIENRSGASSV